MYNHFRVVIWCKTEESITSSDLTNQIIVETDRRYVLRTSNGMSHEITYTGPLNQYKNPET